MKSTLKKLLIAAGICVASTSAFATNWYYLNIHNNSGYDIHMNNEEGGTEYWDGIGEGHEGVRELAGDTDYIIRNTTTDISVTKDNYTWGSPDHKYFSLTMNGKKVIFYIENEHNEYFGIGADYHDKYGLIDMNDSGKNTHVIDMWIDAWGIVRVQTYDGNNCSNHTQYGYPGACMIPGTGSNFVGRFSNITGYDQNGKYMPGKYPAQGKKACFVPQWDATKDYGKDRAEVVQNNSLYASKWWPKVGDAPVTHSGGGASDAWQKIGDCDPDFMLGNSPSPVPSPSPAPAPSPSTPGVSDMGNWDSGKNYSVNWSGAAPVYPVVSYEGKKWVACSNTNAGQRPGHNAWPDTWNAWVEYNGNLKQSCSIIKSSATVKIPAPKGTYDFGQWKAGEYPVVYTPREIHPFVTYNGKGYVACNGDTTAKDVPGKSDAWKEVNGSLGNTCGYTVHSYKKQSPTPSIVKSNVSFW